MMRGLALTGMLLVAGCRLVPDHQQNERSSATRAAAASHMSAPKPVPAGQPVTIIAVGDIAMENARHYRTAKLAENLIRSREISAVLLLGDTQYWDGEYSEYLDQFHHSWGRRSILPLVRPIPGNHEYNDDSGEAAGYFDYFNGKGAATGPAGPRGVGYYSFDLGDWHVVALNTSNGCRKISCAKGSPMERWLRADLAAHATTCTLALHHHPRFQQGKRHSDNPAVAPLWSALYDHGVDVTLSGHDHNYQQLAPMDPNGRLDPKRGIRSFVVGTGGADHHERFDASKYAQALEQRRAGSDGVLLMTLAPSEYSWEFVAVSDRPTGDVVARGRERCR